jgi:hypothetical protein
MTDLGARCYRCLLRVFPRSFRRRHGAAMLEQFRAHRHALRGRPLAIAHLWARAVADVLRHGAAYRLDTARQAV